MRKNMIILLCLSFGWLHFADGQPFVLPVIINKDQQRLTHASVNDTVCLPCQVLSTTSKQSGEVLFYWRKNNVIIRQHPRYKRIYNQCLEIPNVEAQDAGYYTCYAHNMHGKDDAERVLIVDGRMPERPGTTVKPDRTRQPPPIFTGEQLPKILEGKDLVTRRAKAGSRVKLRCRVSGTPAPSVVWFKDKLRLSSEASTRYLFKPARLVIKNFKKSDAGTFSCVATNRLGSTNVTYVLRFEKRRNLTTELRTVQESLTLRPGVNVTLDCAVKKYYVKILHWYVQSERQSRRGSGHRALPSLAAGVFHDRVFIINGSHISRYYLFNVSEQDSGKYTCIAGLKGQDGKSFTVKIISVNVTTAPVSTTYENRNAFQITLFLMISIPLILGLVCILVIIACWRCHVQVRKQPESLPDRETSQQVDYDFRENECGFLGPVPTGSLRVHKPSLHDSKSGTHGNLNNKDTLYFSLGHLDLHSRLPKRTFPVRQVHSSLCLPAPVCLARKETKLFSVSNPAEACQQGNGHDRNTSPVGAAPAPRRSDSSETTCVRIRSKFRCSDSFLDRLVVDLTGRIRLKGSTRHCSRGSKSLPELIGRFECRGTFLQTSRSSCSGGLSSRSVKLSDALGKQCSRLSVTKSEMCLKDSANSSALDAGYASTNSPLFFDLGRRARVRRQGIDDDRSQISSDVDMNFDDTSSPLQQSIDRTVKLLAEETSLMRKGSTRGVASSCAGEFLSANGRPSEYSTGVVT